MFWKSEKGGEGCDYNNQKVSKLILERNIFSETENIKEYSICIYILIPVLVYLVRKKCLTKLQDILLLIHIILMIFFIYKT